MSVARTLAHPEIVRLASALKKRAGTAHKSEGESRLAAVALILRSTGAGDIEMLFVRRAEYAEDPWSGQVALPGGRFDESDESLRQTAVRETWEETAIDLTADGALLGTLDDAQPSTPVKPPFVVRPFVFAASSEVATVPGAEVADAFWVSLDALRVDDAWVETAVHARDTVRRVQAFHHGPHVIWGLTERIVRQLLDLAPALAPRFRLA